MRKLKTVLAGAAAAFLLTIALAPVMAPAFASHTCADSYPPAPNCEVRAHRQGTGPGGDGNGDVAGTGTGTGEELPFTGAEMTLYVLGGIALIGTGALIVRQTRRSRTAA